MKHTYILISVMFCLKAQGFFGLNVPEMLRKRTVFQVQPTYKKLIFQRTLFSALSKKIKPQLARQVTSKQKGINHPKDTSTEGILVREIGPNDFINLQEKIVKKEDSHRNKTCKQVLELFRKRAYKNSLELLGSALKKQPHNMLYKLQRGHALLYSGDLEKAIDTFQEVKNSSLHKSQFFSYALLGAGYSQKLLGKTNEAEICLTTLNDMSSYPDYHYFSSILLIWVRLTNGRLKTGWSDARKLSPGDTIKLYSFVKSYDLQNKHIVISSIGGLGDTFMFLSRYAKELKKGGAKITAVIQKPLVKIFKRCPWIDVVLPTGSIVPSSDVSVNTLDLPAAFDSSPESIPCEFPYLTFDEKVLEYWKKQLIKDKKPKVFVSYAASQKHDDEMRPAFAHRTWPIRQLLEELKHADVSIYLGYGDVEQLVGLENDYDNFHVIPDFDTKRGSFEDSLALMKLSDYFVGADSAGIHAAASVNDGSERKIIGILPGRGSKDWRWHDGESSNLSKDGRTPWYPNVRVVEQPTRGDWSGALKEAASIIVKNIK